MIKRYKETTMPQAGERADDGEKLMRKLRHTRFRNNHIVIENTSKAGIKYTKLVRR